MKQLLKLIVDQIVENPKEVKIKESLDNEIVVFNLSVAPDDMGRIIGKNGKIIRAIRTLLRTRAFKEGKKVQVILATEDENQTN